MSRFLINEPPLLVSKTLSCIIGLNEALVLQQIHYYQEISKNIYDEKQWVYNSVANWKKEHFPFWSEATIKRALNSLESKGLLFSANYNKDPRDQTKWYSVDYSVVSKLESEHVTNAFGQNDQMENSNMTKCNEPDCTNASDHHDPMHRSNMTQPLPKTTTENTTENKNLSSQNSNELSDQSKIDFLNRYPEAVIYSANFKKWGTEKDLECAQWLFERKQWLFQERGIGEPDKPNFTEWANTVRLMREIDGRSHKEICQLYKRITLDDFWHSVILCPSKLREQWEKVIVKFASGQKVSVDPVERDNAYMRIIGSRLTPKNRIEEIAAELAGKQGVRNMSDFVGRKAWVGIWQQAAEQAAKEVTV